MKWGDVMRRWLEAKVRVCQDRVCMRWIVIGMMIGLAVAGGIGYYLFQLSLPEEIPSRSLKI